MSGVPNAWAAAAEFSSVDFHRAVMLPFYDHYLKGLATSWTSRPSVEYAVRGSNIVRTAQQWPPETVRYEKFYLDPRRSGSVHSLNDGTLSKEPPEGGATSYSYPNPGWVAGVVGFGPKGPASGFDPARRVLTFTSPILEHDLEIAGPLKLTLFAASTATDTDFFIKVSDQFPQPDAQFEEGLNPAFEVVTRGWLRASHRALDEAESSEMIPVHPHDREEPLTLGEITTFEISLEPQAYLFKAGHRIRLEIVNGDSPVSEALWPHYYRPDKIGVDTIHHAPHRLSVLYLPVT
jgi:putative CocE/NonD family hydrolase